MTGRRRNLSDASVHGLNPSKSSRHADRLHPEENRIVEARFACLNAFVDRGVLLAGGTLNSHATNFEIVLPAASSEAAALEMVNGDPAVRFGVVGAELFPYRIALVSDKILDPPKISPSEAARTSTNRSLRRRHSSRGIACSRTPRIVPSRAYTRFAETSPPARRMAVAAPRVPILSRCRAVPASTRVSAAAASFPISDRSTNYGTAGPS